MNPNTSICDHCGFNSSELIKAHNEIKNLQELQKDILPIIKDINNTMKYAEDTIAELRKEIEEMKLLINKEKNVHRFN